MHKEQLVHPIDFDRFTNKTNCDSTLAEIIVAVKSRLMVKRGQLNFSRF